VDLKIAERQGVEIDYCPDCRGVWLDRGELDKIVERPYASSMNTQAQQGPQSYQSGSHREHYKNEHHNDHGYSQNGQHRKKSWLSELFD